MAALIRLQFLVEGKQAAIAEAGDMVGAINSSISTIASTAEKAMGSAAASITKNLQNIAAVAGVAFSTFGVQSVTWLGEVNQSVRLLNADVERLAANLSGVRLPTMRPGGGFSGPAASAFAQSAGAVPSPINAAAATGAAAANIQAEINRRNLNSVGDQQYVSTRAAGSRYDQSYRDDAGQEYILRSLEGMAESLKAVNGPNQAALVEQFMARRDKIDEWNQSAAVGAANMDRRYETDVARFKPRDGGGGMVGDAEGGVDAIVAALGLDEKAGSNNDKAAEMAAKAQSKLQAGLDRLAERELARWSKEMDKLESQGDSQPKDSHVDLFRSEMAYQSEMRARAGLQAASSGIASHGMEEDVRDYRSSSSSVLTPIEYGPLDWERYQSRGGSGVRKDDADSHAEAIMQSIGMDEGSFDKADAAKAKIDAAAERAFLREQNEIERALDGLGNQELRAGQRSRAEGAASEAAYNAQQAALTARDSANERNLGQMSGYRLGSSTLDAHGIVTGQNYSRQAGLFSNTESVSLNLKTGEMSRTIQESSSELSKLWTSIAGDGGKASQAMNVAFAPLRGVASVIGGIDRQWQSLGNTMIRVSAMFYSFERIGRMIEGAFLGPYEKINAASEAAIKFRQSIAGTVGGMGNAGVVDDQMIALSRNIPLSLEQTRHMAEMVTQVPALAPQLALSDPHASAGVMGQYTDIATRMSISNPQAGQDEIIKAIGNALEGNLRGLRLVARINPDDLAAMSGMSLKQLQGNNGALLSSIQQVMRSRVSDSTVRERDSLPTVQWEKFTEQFSVAMQRIGLESGLFTTISSKFHDMMEELATYVDSPEFHVRAKAIGDDLGHIFENVLGAGGSFLKGLSGAAGVADTPDKLMAQIQEIVHGLAGGSDRLAPVAGSVGSSLNSIETSLVGFVSKLKMTAESVEEAKSRWEDTSFKPSIERNIARSNWQTEAGVDYTNNLLGYNAAGISHQTALDVNNQGMGALHSLFTSSGWGELGLFLTGNQNHDQKGATVNSAGGTNQQAFVSELLDAIRSDPDRSVRNGKFVSQEELNNLATGLAQKYMVDLPGIGFKAAGPGGPAGTGEVNVTNQQRTVAANDASFKKLGVDDDLAAGAGLYSQKFAGTLQQIESLGGSLPDHFDKLSKTLDDGERSLNSIFQKFKIDPTDGQESPGNFFQKVKEWEANRVDSLQSEMNGLMENLPQMTDADSWDSTFAKIQGLQNDIALTINGLDAAMKQANDAMGKSAGKFIVAGTQELKGEDPIVRSQMMNMFLSGNTDVQRRIAGQRLGVSDLSTISPADLEMMAGLGAVSKQDRPKLLQEQTGYGLDAIKAAGLRNQTAEGSSLFFGPGIQAQQLQYLQGQMPAYQQQYQQAQADYGAKPGDETALAMARAGAAVQALQAQIVQLQHATNQAQQGFVQFGNSAQESITKSLGQAIDDMIMKTGNLKDVWKSLGKELVSSFSQMSSKQLMNGMFGDPTEKGGKGGFGGMIGSVFDFIKPPSEPAKDANGKPIQPDTAAKDPWAGGLMGIILRGAASGISNIFGGGASGDPYRVTDGGFDDPGMSDVPIGQANGGIFSGPFRAFAGGGIVRKPTLGLVGERTDGTPEGVVPLLGRGNTIPLGMDSSGPHAILPGGRRIAASFGMAEGGVVMGGFDSLAFADGGIAHGGFSGIGSARPAQQSLTIYNVANVDEAVQRGYDKNKGHIMNEVLASGRPGGQLRRMLNKSS